MRRDSKLDPNDEILSPQSWPPPPYSRAGFMATWRDHRGQFILEWDLFRDFNLDRVQVDAVNINVVDMWRICVILSVDLCDHFSTCLSSHHISQTSLFIKTLEAPFQAGAEILSGESLKRISPQFSCYCCYGSTACSRNHAVLFGMSFLSTEFVVDIFSRCLLNLAKYIAIFCFRIIVKHL